MSDLKDHGFVRVKCERCDNADVWMKCDRCAKSSNFLLTPDAAKCSCGASYTHAVCLCGERVERSALHPVAFDAGPVALSDFEVDYRRVAVLLGAVGLGIFTTWYLLF